MHPPADRHHKQQPKTDATRAQLNYRIQRIVSLFKRHGFR